MDFGRDLIKEESTTTQSGIRILPLPKNVATEASGGEGEGTTSADQNESSSQTPENDPDQNHVDELLIRCANKAAADLFLSSGTNVISTMNKKKRKSSTVSDVSDLFPTHDENSLALVDCKLYPTQLLPSTRKIEPNDLVVIFESFDTLNFVYAKSKAIFNNKNGAFHHDDFIGKNYGCKIRSRPTGLGFVYLLKPTPELWTRSLNHRTQIVHELDQSLIVFHLNLRPGMIVAESGTGSGAFSHSILRSIAPHGKLHTYEFNHARVKTAREEFERNGLQKMVKVHWRDVCGKSKDANIADGSFYALNESTGGTKKVNSSNDGSADVREGKDDEEEVIGCGGFKLGPAAVHAIFLDLPEPWLAVPHAAHTIKPCGKICSYSPCVEQSQKTIERMKSSGFHSIKTIEVRLREHYVDDVPLERVPTAKLPRKPNVPFIPGQTAPVTPPPQISEVDDVMMTPTSPDPRDCAIDDSKAKPVEENKSSSQGNSEDEQQNISKKRRRMLCARPFGTMRGHSAFLTFATAGNKCYPDPNTCDENGESMKQG